MKHYLRVSIFAAAFVSGMVSTRSAADTLQPLSLSGWSSDLIAENTAANPFAAGVTDFKISGFNWYQQGAPNSSQGLPVSGTFTSLFNPNTTFQFQPYIGNNAVFNTGTLTLNTPAPFQTLAFLTSAQGGTGDTFHLTLNFADNSSTVLATTFDPDWTVSGNNALSNIGLVNGANWSSFYSGTLNMFEHDYTLTPTDAAKTLESITLTHDSGNSETLFAVSGLVIPEPNSVALVFAGLGIFGIRRFLKKRA